LDASIFIADRPVFIYAAVENDLKMRQLEARGAITIILSNGRGKVDLPAMMRDLARREINELHVEAGSKLNGSLVREGLVDEFLVYLAPKLVGEGLGMLQWGPLAELSQALELDFRAVDKVGPDMRLVARVNGRDAF